MAHLGLSAGEAWIAALLVLFGTAAAGWVSAATTALTAASQARLLALEKAGDRRAATVIRLLLDKERLIGAMMIAGVAVNAALACVVAALFAGAYGPAGVIYALLLMTLLVVVAVEIGPKTLAIARADALALAAAGPAALIVAALGPVIAATESAVRRALRLVGVRVEDGVAVLSAHEELTGSVDLMSKESGAVKSDLRMIERVLALKDLIVADVMLHRTKMLSIDADQPPETIVREALASPYTRMPLWRDSPENIIGLIHARDLLRALAAAGGDAAKLDLKAIAQPPWFVPDTTALPDQLRAFLQKKTHFAFAIDEYGVVMGLVTLEDVLEEIVGDIKDEHDVAATGVRPQRDGSVVVDGAAPIRDVNRAMGWNLPDDSGPTSIAGLVIQEARTIPDAGQIFTFHGFRFDVLRKQRNRIVTLKITPLPNGGAAGGS
jgi:Mg2+/Co2+ transporter CorB